HGEHKDPPRSCPCEPSWLRVFVVSFLVVALLGQEFTSSSQDRDDTKGAAAAALDLHGQSNHLESLDRQCVEVGDILERWNAGLEQDPMALEELRLTAVDAGRVEPDGADFSIFQQPSRRSRIEAREMQLCDCFGPAPIRSQILL